MIEAITVGSFALVCLISVFRTNWALALLTVFFPFKQALQASSGFFISNFALPNYIVAVVLGLATLRAALKRTAPFLGYLSFQYWGILTLFAWSAISLVWTPSRGPAIDFIVGNIPYLVLYVVIGPMLIGDVREYRSFLLTLLPVSLLVAAVILLNPAFSSETGRMGVQIAANVRTNPLAIGELGGIMMITAALIRGSSTSIGLAVLRAVALGAGTILAFQSGSRGQLAFAILVAIFCFPVARRVRSIGGFFGAAFGSLAVAAVVVVISQFVLEGNLLARWEARSMDAGFGVRASNLLDLISEWLSSPLAWVFGLGFNAFSSLGAAQAFEEYSHNVSVDVLTELGLPMFCIYLGLISQSVRASAWLVRTYGDDPSSRSTCALAVAFAAYQFLLANKQGMLWSSPALFLSLLTVSRLQSRAVFEAEIPMLSESRANA
jgi:hypothetical protein